MKIMLFILLAFLMVSVSIQARPEEEICGENLDGYIAEIKSLEKEIHKLNLINGMHLSRDQMKLILKEARFLEDDLKDPDEGRPEALKTGAEEVKVLRSLRDSLEKGKDNFHALKEKYKRIEEKKRKPGRLRPQVLKRVEEAALRVEGVLTGAQQEILSAFKPCLIPTQDLKNPVRVGQASNTGPVERYLDLIRMLPDFVYANQLNDIVDQAVTVASHRMGDLEGTKRADYTRKMLKISRQAREMNDVDYALSRSELAVQLDPVDQTLKIKDNLSEMGVSRYQIQGKIVQFLLTPKVIPLLERRLERMKAEDQARSKGH